MLPMSEIAAMKATVAEEWASPIADLVGARWGLTPAALRWWRSSSSHVFVASDEEDARGVLFARFARRQSRAGDRLAHGAAVQELLSGFSGVADLVPSEADRRIEFVPTPLGEMVAIVVQGIDGDELEAEELDEQRATEWGRALAAFHAASPAPLETAEDRTQVFQSLAADGDEELAAAASKLVGHAGTAGRARLVIGHGDFELDNVRWTSEGIVCFDLDESGAMPLEVDIASATRDLYEPTGNEPLRPDLLDAFLHGYTESSCVAVTAEDLLLARATVAATSWISTARALDLADAGRHGLAELEQALLRHVARSRSIVIDATRRLAHG